MACNENKGVHSSSRPRQTSAADELANMRKREKRTLALMVGIYCRGQGHAKRAEHGPGPHGSGLCPQCQNLVDYCFERISRCPRMEVKTSCSACPTRCYKPDMRERVRKVMRYAGPRMLLYNPGDAIRHLCFVRIKSTRKRG